MSDFLTVDSETGRLELASTLSCVNCGSKMTQGHLRGCPSRLVALETDELSTSYRPDALDDLRSYQGGTRPTLVHKGSFGDFEHVGGGDCRCKPTCYEPLHP